MSNLLPTASPDQQRLPNVVALEFRTDYKTDKATGEIVPVEIVKWGRRGDFTYAQEVEIKRLSRPMPQAEGDIPMANPLWDALRPAYEAWRKGQEVPENGVPLEAWPALNKAQIKALRAAQYRTVEDVAAVTDSQLGTIRLPDPRQVRDSARLFLRAKEDATVIARTVGERDREIEAMRAQLSEDRELIAQLSAKLKEMEGAASHAPPPLPEPPRPLAAPNRLNARR